MKGIIIYKGKYGATKQYANWLSAALSIPVSPAGEEINKELIDADYIIMGSSIYIGKLQLRKWIRQHRSLLLNKKIFLFLVAGTPVSEREKLQQYINANIEAEITARCTFFFLPGKLEFKKLSFLDKMLMTIGSRLAKSRGEHIAVTDYNDVEAVHLSPIITTINKLNGR
jgi:menaquinone-dependent protoporphyrinogen IX oxidase